MSLNTQSTSERNPENKETLSVEEFLEEFQKIILQSQSLLDRMPETTTYADVDKLVGMKTELTQLVAEINQGFQDRNVEVKKF